MTKKTTHTIQDVEGLILERLNKLRDSNDKTEQRKLRSEILKLEKHYNDCNGKHINGKKYPVREIPPKVSKKELLDLIDSVGDIPSKKYVNAGLDLSGVSPGSNRFTFKELG